MRLWKSRKKYEQFTEALSVREKENSCETTSGSS